jgi:OPT family oligopeptide transporter
VISWLGVFLAVPTKRQMINYEQLPFPSGTAAATTLRTLHARGGEAARQAKALLYSGALGALITWLRDANASWLSWYPKIPSTWGTSWIKPWIYKGEPLSLSQVTMAFEGSLLFIAAGAIMNFRQAWSLLLGAIVNYCFLAPAMLNAGVIETASFSRISRWSLWTGVPMLVTSGLLLFFINWKSVVRAFGTITAMFAPQDAHKKNDPMERIEVPGSWFIGGVGVVGTMAIILGHVLFHITWWMGVIAVLSTFFLVVVASRATGETDITPVGPISKITQLSFGAIKPGDVSVNLLTAQITAGATSHAGDLLTDLKSGYLLGANPRQQFFAQFFGVLAGGMIVVPVFFILIPDVSLLATEKWPAPAALTWRGVAELLAKGPGALHPTARLGLAIGAALGIVLPLIEMALPKHKKFIPSATGLGLAFTINGFNSISMFIGALLAAWFMKVRPEVAKKYAVPVSSGIIAGESLMGVTIALMTVAGWLR